MTALALSLPENQDPIEQLELYMQKTILWVKSQGFGPVPSSKFLEDTIKELAKEQNRLTLQACFD